MNPNDITAHYAAERLSLLMQLEKAKQQIEQIEAELKAKAQE